MINKKAQHEMIGFVLIIIIVVVIGLVFLMFSIKKPTTNVQTSAELSSLLEASMLYTTECSTTFIPEYYNINELIGQCYKFRDKKCLNNDSVCNALSASLNKAITQSLDVDENKPNKAFKFNIKDWQNQSLLSIEQGVFDNCDSVIGASYSKYIINAGNIDIYLELCKQA